MQVKNFLCKVLIVGMYQIQNLVSTETQYNPLLQVFSNFIQPGTPHVQKCVKFVENQRQNEWTQPS